MCLVGVVVRRYIDFLKLLIPAPLVSALFSQHHPNFFVHFLMCFIASKESFLVSSMARILYNNNNHHQ